MSKRLGQIVLNIGNEEYVELIHDVQTLKHKPFFYLHLERNVFEKKMRELNGNSLDLREISMKILKIWWRIKPKDFSLSLECIVSLNSLIKFDLGVGFSPKSDLLR